MSPLARLGKVATPRARSAAVLVMLAASALQGPTVLAQVEPLDSRQAKMAPANPVAGDLARDSSSLSMLTSLSRTVARPHLDGSVAPELRYRLVDAYQLAMTTVRKQPTCNALFSRLGALGDETLARTLYRGGGEVGACLRPVPAFTCVGCPQTVVCPSFLRLGAAAGATILIHEALHFAGLKERPTHPDAMSALEITAMVRENCHL